MSCVLEPGVHLLENPIQEYAWGSRVALPRLLGKPEPAARPQAELWIGAHPRASSSLRLPGGTRSLAELLEEAPETILGERAWRRPDAGCFPLLLKILAVERPLSIQAHPDAEQARRGFLREEAAGIPRDAARRSYRDDRPKPELVCALEPFRLLKGFRPWAELQDLWRGLELPIPEDLPAGREIEGLFRWWMQRGEPEVEAVLARARRGLEAGGGPRSRPHAWLGELLELHPRDRGALAPLLLNDRILGPGEALFVGPGELHCYLSGLAVELQASSDNVLRGGLTGKHVDVAELLAVLDFRAGEARALRPEPAPGGVHRYPAPTSAFLLERLDPGQELAPPWRVEGVELLLCVEGHARVVPEGGEALALGPGCAALVCAGVPGYRIGGPARVFRARLPGAAGPGGS